MQHTLGMLRMLLDLKLLNMFEYLEVGCCQEGQMLHQALQK